MIHARLIHARLIHARLIHARFRVVGEVLGEYRYSSQ
ncbi:hypothetical protein [Spirochaeta africana]